MSKWISFLGVLAAVLGLSVFPWTPFPVIHLVLILSAALIGAIFQAIAAPAAAYWRRFGLHVTSPAPASRLTTLKVFVVHDATSLAAAEEVRERHASRDLEVELQLIDPSTSNAQTIMPATMDSAHAVYFIWTDLVRRSPDTRRALEDWTWKHLEVPIVVVNPENIPFDGLNFTVMAPRNTGPSELLLQAISRTKMWIGLATKVHRWWIIAAASTLVAVLPLSVIGVELIITKIGLAERDVIVEPNFTELATNLFRARLREESQPSVGMLRADLTDIAKSAMEEIVRITHARSGSQDHISVFRKINETLVRVDDGPPHDGPGNPLSMASIAGCALRTNSFVLWEAECKAGTPAAWDSSGTKIGSCGSKDTVQLDGRDEVCIYAPVYKKLHNHGVLCFSAALVTSANSTPSDTVVCAVSGDRNTAFLRTPAARAKLSAFALVANSLPTNRLIPKAAN
jgi:hypothetical protein